MNVASKFQSTKFGSWIKRTDRNSKSFPLFGLIVSLVILISFALYTYANTGLSGLSGYLLTSLVAALAGFIPIPLLPRGSGWQSLAIWIVWPGLLLAVIYVRGHVIAWIVGCGIGLMLGVYLSYRVWLRKRKNSGISGPVIIRKEGRGLSRRSVASKLTIPSFREAILQLDGDHNAALCLLKSGHRLDILGDSESTLIVYYSSDPDDDNAWRRLSQSHPKDPGTEITVPLGGIEGRYLERSIVDLALATQACEHFIRTGALDPSLDWENGEDVINRLPPTRLRI